MSFANEILDAIEIMVKQVVEDNTTKIYTGVCKTVSTSTCSLLINGKENIVKYYGGTPTVGAVYQVFIPFGNMSTAFIIAPGAGGQDPETGVSSVNGKTGAVVLTASDVGALPNTTIIPTKTSELDNDSGFIDSSALDGYAKTTDIPTKTSQLTNNSGFITVNDVPVKSVDGSTGAVVTNAVKTTSQSLTDTQKAQARTNIGAGTSSFDGNYESLSNKPTIPTQTSQLENNSGFITTADVPTKTSQLNNDSGFVDTAGASAAAPVQSVNTKTGVVMLTQDDVGNGVTYVRTHNDFTDAAKQQINTNEDNIVMLDSDMEAAQGDITTLKGNVTTLTTALQSKQDKIVGGASTITDDNLTANRALVSNGSGKVVVSTVTSTELGYLDGVTSNVQTQLDKKLESAPVTSVNTKTGAVVLDALDVGALPDTTSIPTKTSDLTNDSGYITSDDVPVKSVNGKTGNVELVASDIGALAAPATMTANQWFKTDAGGNVVLSALPNASTGARGITYLVNSYTRMDTDKAVTPKALNDVYNLIPEVTQTLGSSTTKVPSEKAVADALSGAGAGDMLKTIYDPTGSVAQAGGIPDYVEVNGGKIDTIKVNGVAQPITNKEVDIAAVTSVNGQTGDVTVTADIPDNLVKYTAVSDIQSVDGLNADTLEGHNAAYFATASGLSTVDGKVSTNTNNIATLSTSLSMANGNITTLQEGKLDKSGDTMTGALVAQNNANYTTAQVRNIIVSTADPSGGSDGMLWIKYTP